MTRLYSLAHAIIHTPDLSNIISVGTYDITGARVCRIASRAPALDSRGHNQNYNVNNHRNGAHVIFLTITELRIFG